MLEGVVGEVAHAGVLAGADAVLDPRAAAVAQLQRGDVLAVLVGEEAGVPVAVFVEDREWRAGMRPLAPDDQPGSLGPGGQVQTVGQLRDARAVPSFPIAVDRLLPRGFRDLEDRGADRFAELVADREADLERPSSRR